MPLFGEIFLSDILNKPVLDQRGDVLGRLKDIFVVRGEPLPKVDALIVEKNKTMHRIPWSAVNLFNKKIMSADIYEGAMTAYAYNEEDLLAARDILDKQIVDVDGVKVVRANDIKLEGFKTDVVLVAIDVGMRGILRRLGVERFGEDFLKFFRTGMSYHLISWKYMQPLQPKLSTITLTVPRNMVKELHPADIAELISQVSPDEGIQLIKHLDVETAADAISELEPDEKTAVIAGMDAQKAADIIEEMAPDEAADVIGELSAERAREILENIEQEEAEDIQELMSHESDTAGGLMTKEFIAYQPDISVGEAIERFKKDAPEIEAVYYIYTVDEEEKLLGVLSLTELLLSSPDTKLADIMETNIKSVGPDMDDMEVAHIITKYNLVAMPVVDVDNCLLGIVTVDDIMNMILPPHSRRKRRGV